MKSLIVVHVKGSEQPYEFRNAEVAGMPGVFIIQNAQGEHLAMFPIHAVEAILYPEGDSRITGVTL